jgi:uncharacterized protein involved in outer membrane biogenesis
MRKLMIAGAVLAVLVLAVVFLAANLEKIVNKNKGTILARADSTLGREVSVGEIGVTFKGGLGVTLDKVVIGEDPAFGKEPFVSASELQVNVKILPLLRKEFQVKRVVLRDPLIRIVKNKNGVLNTQSIVDRLSSSGSAQSGEGPAAAVPLVVSLASIDNGEMDYVDEMQDVSIKVRKIGTSVTDFDIAKPLSIDMQAALFSDDRNVELRGTVGPLPTGATAGEKTPAIPIDLDAMIDPVDLAQVLSAMPRVSQGFPKDLSVTGPVTAHVTAKGTAPELEISGTLDGARVVIKGPQGFNKTSGVPLSVDFNGRLSPEKFTIESARAKFASAELTATGDYFLSEPPVVALDIESQSIDLAGWETIVPAAAPYKLSGRAAVSARVDGELKPGAPPPVVGKAKITDASATLPQLLNPVKAVRADIAFSQERAEITNASLEIGGSRVSGRAVVEKFQPVTMSYEATSPFFALADVVPPQPTVKKPEHLDGLVVKGRITVDPATKLPSGPGTAASASGSVANVDYTDLSASYEIDGTTTRFSGLKASALDGVISGSGAVTAADSGSSFDIKLDAEKVNITELLVALPGSVQKSLRGIASLKLSIAGSGKEWPDIQKSLKGSGDAELVDGEIADVNLAGAIFDEVGRYLGGADLISNQLKAKYPAIFQQKSTSFNDLKSDFVVENGRLLARNLQLKQADYGILAKGSIGFDRSLDIAATFVVAKKLADDLSKSYPAAAYLKNSRGEIELPLVLAGTLPNVEVKPDPKYFKSLAEKGLVDKGLDVLKKSPLKDLFPGEKKPTAPADTTQKR